MDFNDLLNPMLLGTVTDMMSGTSMTYTQGTVVEVEYDINEGVEYTIRINGAVLVAGAPWPGAGCSSVTSMTLSTTPSATVFAGDVYYDNFCMTDSIGSGYCVANPNSTGAPTEISAIGVTNASMNAVTLRLDNMPANSFGYFLCSQTQGFVQNPNGSAGNLCLGGAIGRYVGAGQIQNAGGSGSISLAIDLTQTPQPQGMVAVVAGDTWNFQGWHRDINSMNNFSAGLEIDFE